MSVENQAISAPIQNAQNKKKFATDSDVLQFAQQASADYFTRVGQSNSWLDQLFRVDIMWNDIEKRMVVNEIETFERSRL